MTTAIELIAKERSEQIEKHGFTLQHDKENYNEEKTGNYAEPSDLIMASTAVIHGNKTMFPLSWKENQSLFIEKIVAKAYKDRLVIAAALVAAEIDRVISNEDPIYDPEKCKIKEVVPPTIDYEAEVKKVYPDASIHKVSEYFLVVYGELNAPISDKFSNPHQAWMDVYNSMRKVQDKEYTEFEMHEAKLSAMKYGASMADKDLFTAEDVFNLMTSGMVCISRDSIRQMIANYKKEKQ